jgi:hypothetical protein
MTEMPCDTVLPNEEFDDIMNQISRLPPRKQAKWYKVVNHRTGKTILRFKNGALVDFTPDGEQMVRRANELNMANIAGNFTSEEARLWVQQVLEAEAQE